MDLTELKNTWTVLEEQLKKNETVNKKVIHEMLQKRSSRSLGRLINYDFFGGLLLLIILIPFWVWLYNRVDFMNIISVKILSITGVIISLVGSIWYYFRLKYLMKIDFFGNMRDNIYCINKYNIMIKQDKIVQYFVLAPILFSMGAFCYYELKANFLHWVFLIFVAIAAVVFAFWMYKKIYDINIQSIKQSLEELSELKEE
jgi:hypothetical protein